MSPIGVFYHCKISGSGIPSKADSIKIVAEQMHDLKKSGLENEAAEIYVGINGDQSDAAAITPLLPKKARVHTHGSQAKWEFGTLQLLYQWAIRKPGFHVFYHHSKGVTAPQDGLKRWHRRIMQQMLVYEWARCNRDLERGFQIAGRHWEPNLDFPFRKVPHYMVGNFWWTTTRWISFLEPPPANDKLDKDRLLCEWWIGSVNWTPIVMDYLFPERSQKFVDRGWVKP